MVLQVYFELGQSYSMALLLLFQHFKSHLVLVTLMVIHFFMLGLESLDDKIKMEYIMDLAIKSYWLTLSCPDKLQSFGITCIVIFFTVHRL